MLFNLTQDPYEQHNLSQEQPEIANQAMAYLADWQQQMALAAPSDTDPMLTVLREGGPFHTRGRMHAYLQDLRSSGRTQHAERLERLHPDEV